MILQRLAEHYDRLEASGAAKLMLPGFSAQKVSFCVVLEKDGSLNSFSSMQVEDNGKWRPTTLGLPGNTKASGSGKNPCFLWDRTSYLLGWTSDPDPKKQARAPELYEAFTRRHLKYQSHFADERYNALCTFLEAWDPLSAKEHLKELEGITRDCGIFKIAGEQGYLHQLFSMPADWDADKPKNKRSSVIVSGQCSVTGQFSEIARLHKPEIKGVFNAPPRGVPFVSMDKEAYTSYGKDQSFNAPVSTVAVFKYANALNHLLAQKDRRTGLGDATVVYWADANSQDAQAQLDVLAALFGSPLTTEETPDVPVEDQGRVQEARLLLSQLRDGTALSTIKAQDAQTRYFMLGLSPNASRLSVRLWVEADAREARCRLSKHVQDLALKGSVDDRPLPLWRIVAATGRAELDPKGRLKSFDTKGISPQLAGDLARSVLLGSPYPQSLLSTMVRRIRSDGHIAFVRVSAIKAVLTRNARLRGASMEIPMELQSALPDVAYRCGRVFALLEKAQTDSLGTDLNSTIKDRYFSSASATPALVFPRLFRLNGHHLAKLPVPSKTFYERQFSAAMAEPFHFPKQLSLEQQGRFIVGYFQQRQSLYTKKEKAPQEETTAA